MAITYPLAMPDVCRVVTTLPREINAVVVSRSLFTGAQQVLRWPAQSWELDVTVYPKTIAQFQEWEAWRTALCGPAGTFLLGLRGRIKRGSASAATVTGAAQSATPTITMTGTLLAGDMIQIGLGAAATLHRVLASRDGSGQLDIWPALRRSVSGATVVLDRPQGNFRLAQSSQEGVARHFDTISFTAMEVI
ncbi:hypothetical protein [Frigidibacter sp. MR17.24]|uniref:hypothetical protein n=1 Tax=Frigidibacter sp. MR17.24 TaxID=3127345 RepID=UPI003012E1D5